MERIALFAGTFDPYTIGHHSVVTRALSMFDKIIIAVGCNSAKKTMFSTEARIAAIRRVYTGEPRIEVVSYNGLTTDFAKEKNACCLLRGARSVKDFEYERDLADINRLTGEIETIILISEPQYASVSSSTIRELIGFGKDVSKFIP